MTADILPPMPEVGQTIPYLHGTITRTEAVRFVARYGSGSFPSPARTHLATIAYTSAANRIRRDAGVPALKLPCAYCGEKPRYSDKNIYCSLQHRQMALGQTVTPPRGSVDYVPPILLRVLPDMPYRPRYIDQRGIAPDFAKWVAEADALIVARGGKRPPAHGYCHPENYAVEIEESA